MAGYGFGAKVERRRRRTGGGSQLIAAAWLDDVMAEDRQHSLLLPIAVRLPGAEIQRTRYRPYGIPELPDVVALAEQSHGVHFYDTDASIVAAVTEFFEAASRRGERLLIVATPDHLSAIAAELHRRNLHPGPGSYQALDAEETLESFLVRGAPDRDRFREVVGSLVRDLRSAGPLSIYGEMVNLLWERGDIVGAIRLEGFWNDLATDVEFALLCGYRSDRDGDTSSIVGAISALHSHCVASYS